MTNAAAIGYMILAANKNDFDYEMIQVLLRLMREEMDFTKEEEAEEAYNNF